MKTKGTCADASDLVEEIKECLTLARQGARPTFKADLQVRLIRQVLAELQSGRIENYGFERLIREVQLKLGAEEARIVLPRSEDKGERVSVSRAHSDRRSPFKRNIGVLTLR
jgi:hypothetical protein